MSNSDVMSNIANGYAMARNSIVSNASARNLRASITLLLVSFLAGCGGGNEGGNNNAPTPPSPVGSVAAMDGFGAVKPSTATRVDLSAFVRGQGATLTALKSGQPECNASGLLGLTAEVYIDNGGLCQYTFTASNGGSEASASLNMLASSKASPVLPTLSQAMTLGSGNATFNLETLLGADWPSGYRLDASSLVVQGGSVQGAVTASGNSVVYTPPTTPDWNRIVFILKDAARPGEDALGTLYVTISDIVNQAPVIGKPKYDYNAETGMTPVTAESKVLDLGSLTGLNVSDPEGRAWQLVEVQSYSATVTPVDPNSVTNKQFTFTAGTIGTHIVSYIVGDHEGGFTAGLMSITVGTKERTKDWANITVGDMTFLATPLYSETGSAGVTAAEGVWDSGVNLVDTPPGNTVAGVTDTQANAYCSSIGWRMATQASLDILRTTTVADSARGKYPVHRSYLVAGTSVNTYLTYNLSTGATAVYTPGTTANQYVMCFKYTNDGMMSYTPVSNPQSGYSNTVISDGATWWLLGQIDSDGGISILIEDAVTNYGSGSLNVANFRLSSEGCSGGTCSLEAKADPEEYGSFNLGMINGDDRTKSIHIQISFLQNARLTGLRTGVNNSSGGYGQNTIIVTLQDRDGNPVPSGTLVSLNYSFTPFNGVTVTPPPSTPIAVDNNGEVTLTLTYTDKAGGTVTVNSDSQGVKYGLPNAQSISVASVFTSWPNFAEGCAQGTVTVGALTYTCPITEDQAIIGGVSYSGVITESGQYGPAGMRYIRLTAGQARTYCASLGSNYRLPTESELKALYAAKGNMFSAAGWPVSLAFWSSTITGIGSYAVVYLTIGTGSNFYELSNIYTSCVRESANKSLM